MFSGKIKAAVATFLLGAALLLTSIPVEAAGVLTIAVSKTSMNVGDTVVVTVYSKDEGGQDVNADMTITYDAGILEYVGSSAHSANGGGGKITAVGSEIEYTFKAIANGNASVVAEGVSVTAAGIKIPVGGESAPQVETPAPEEPKEEEPADEKPADEAEEPADDDSSETSTENTTPVSKTEGNTTLRSETETNEEIVSIKEGLSLADDINAHVKETTGVEVMVNGVRYEISCSLTTDDIPDGFLVKDIKYKDQKLTGVRSFNGYVYMFYLVNPEDESDQGYFVYEPDTEFFYPFIRIMAGKHRIQIMNPVDIVVIPEGFTKVLMNYKNKFFTAYRCDTNPDFFAFYGADTTGVTAWYQFDNVQLSMQRLNIVTVYPEIEEDDQEAYNTLSDAYDALGEQYVTEKNSFITTVAVLIFIIAFLIVVAINLILRCREIRLMYEEGDYEVDDDDDNDEEEDEEEPENKKGKLSFIEEQYNRLKRTEKSPRAEVIHKAEEYDEYGLDDELDYEDEYEEDIPPVIENNIDVNDIKIAEIDPFADEEIPAVKEEETHAVRNEELPSSKAEQSKKNLFGRFVKPVVDEELEEDFDDELEADVIVPQKKARKMPDADNSIAVRESVMKSSGETLIGRKEKAPEFKSSDDDDDLEFLDI